MTQLSFHGKGQNEQELTHALHEKGRALHTAGAVLIIFSFVLTAFTGCILDSGSSKDTKELDYYAAAPPRTLDPAVAYDDVSINIINNLYERLVTYGPSGSEIVPMLAKNQIAVEDTTYIFHMRGGIKFSSGRVVDAHAVNYSISRVLKMAQPPSWMLRQVLNVSGIYEVDDDHDGIMDVKFVLERPYSGFYQLLAFSVCSIVDPVEVEEHGGVVEGQENDWLAHHSAGSGPFVVKDWKEGENKVTLERNSHYHGGWGGKHIEKAVFRYEPSETLRLEAIKGDKADMADIPVNLLVNLSDETSVKVEFSDTMSVVYIGFNTHTAPFNNSDVRRGFAYAFNYNALVDSILQKKYGERLYGPIPKGVLGYSKDITPRFYFDAEKAVGYFENAGYTVQDGQVTDFGNVTLYISSNNSMMGKIMYLFKENLEAIGIEVNIAQMNITDYYQQIETGNIPVFLAGWSADYADPDDFVFPLLSTGGINLSINYARYSNASVDKMIERGKTTLSPDDRSVIYRNIQDAVNGDAPYIWLYQPKHVAVLKADVTGYTYHPILGVNLYEIYIVK